MKEGVASGHAWGGGGVLGAGHVKEGGGEGK